MTRSESPRPSRRHLLIGLGGLGLLAAGLPGCGGGPSGGALPCGAAAPDGPPTGHAAPEASRWPAHAAVGWADGALPAALGSALDARLAALAALDGVVGLTAALGRPGLGAWCAGAGQADRSSARPVSADTPFWWASVGKAFTATAILQAVQAGTLRLDDRIERWWPAYPLAASISLRQLLTHTGGLPVHGVPAAPAGFGPEEQIAAAARLAPAACPGSAWSYSNVGYMMLGRIVERSSGRALGDVLRESLFEPAGAPAATLLTPANLPADLARAHVDGVAQDPAGWGGVQGAGGVAASAGTMLRCWQALLDGTLLDAAATRGRAERLYTMFGEAGMWYGQGLMLAEFSDTRGRLQRWLAHYGGAAGLNAVTAWDLERRCHVAVVSNSAAPAAAVALALLETAEPWLTAAA